MRGFSILLSAFLFIGCGGGGGGSTQTGDQGTPVSNLAPSGTEQTPQQDEQQTQAEQMYPADQNTTLAQREKEMRDLQKLAGKTMVINYTYAYTAKRTMNFDDAPVPDYGSYFQAHIAGEMDIGYSFLCTTTDAMRKIADEVSKDNIYADYRYFCRWEDSLGNNSAIVFNISEDNVIGGYEYTLSSQNQLIELLDGYDAPLVDSYIY